MEKRTFARLGMGLLGAAVIFAAGNFLPVCFAREGARWYLDSPFVQFLFTMLLYGGGTLSLYLATRSLPRAAPKPRRKMKIGQLVGFFCAGRGLALILSLAGLLLTMALWLMIKGPQGVSEYLNDAFPFLTAAISPSMWYNLISICVVAPTVEELMFRRLVLDPLRPFGDKVAILYSGIAFGLLHMNIQQILYATALGFLLGYILVRTNNIWYCVALHFIFNATSAVLLPVIDDMSRMSALFFAGGWSLLLIALSIVGIVLFFVYMKRIKLDPAPYSFSRPINVRLALFSGWGWPYVLICLAVPVLEIVLL